MLLPLTCTQVLGIELRSSFLHTRTLLNRLSSPLSSEVSQEEPTLIPSKAPKKESRVAPGNTRMRWAIVDLMKGKIV